MKVNYEVLSITPAEGIRSCENCFRPISWIALLKGSDKSELRVGVDCAEKLARKFEAKGSIYQAKKAIKDEAKYLYWLNRPIVIQGDVVFFARPANFLTWSNWEKNLYQYSDTLGLSYMEKQYPELAARVKEKAIII